MTDLILVHHGIKGQKWGVKNGPPYPLGANQKSPAETRLARVHRPKKDSASSETNAESKKRGLQLSDKQKKAIKIGAAAVGVSLAVFGGVALYKYTSVSNYGFRNVYGDPLVDRLDKFPDKAVDLPKSTRFQRISARAIEDYVEQGHTYVSTTFRDNQKYISRMPDELKGRGDGSGTFVHSIKLNKPTRAPSRREAASIYLEQHPNATHARYINFCSRMAGIRNARSVVEDQSQYQKRLDAKAYLDEYQAFVSEVKRRGYNALVDENDATWTSTPLILLDVGDSIQSDKAHRLTLGERVVAEALR